MHVQLRMFAWRCIRNYLLMKPHPPQNKAAKQESFRQELEEAAKINSVKGPLSLG